MVKLLLMCPIWHSGRHCIVFAISFQLHSCLSSVSKARILLMGFLAQIMAGQSLHDCSVSVSTFHEVLSI